MPYDSTRSSRSGSSPATPAGGHPPCWDLLITLARHYPINNLCDLMRVTRLAERFHGRVPDGLIARD